jgi:hypothetical protein
MRALLFGCLAAAVLLPAQDAARVEFFEKKIRPVLAKHCAACHNPKMRMAGLDVTTVEGLAHGGQSGPLWLKDKPEGGKLLEVLSYDERLKMPPTGKLPAEDLEPIKLWVKAGAQLPAGAAAATPRPANKRQFTEGERKFWAFQPVAKPSPPPVKDSSWAQTPIDHFVLASLEAKGLKPAPEASKLTLLRRVFFDLTGLPPTEKDIFDFLDDQRADAYPRLVERLLASPRYAEKWARHWLDVARYADSTGNDEDHRYPYAWRYRDYVIDSFHRDVPYDQFIREQIAGDLLPAPEGVNRRGIIATGFLSLGAKAVAQQDKKKMLTDIYDEQIDVVSKGVLGLTLACARCHDHKFDPLLTKDYYSWMTIFARTKNFRNADSHVSSLLYTPLVPKPEYEQYQKARSVLDKKQGEIDDVIEEQTIEFTAAQAPNLAEYMLAASSSDLAAEAKAKGLREDVLKKWAEYLKPSEEVRPFLEKWTSAKPAQRAAVAQGYQAAFMKRHTEWVNLQRRTRPERRNKMRTMPPPMITREQDPFFYEVMFQGPFTIDAKERDQVFTPEASAKLKALRAEYKVIEKGLPPEPDMACAVSEGTEGGVVSGKVYVRGDYNSFGEDAPPGFPEILAAQQPQNVAGSGRLELANWLASPANPLTARVMANRVWYWHFGEGIVRTPDNFGRMGDRPTHPELLDYLAARFVEKGWSVKQLHREILLSNTYRMSSQTPAEAYAADPENKLFSRFPRRRLSVEEMRDGLLSVDGTIDFTMGGTLQSGFGTDGENSNNRLSVRPETVKRRMVYLPLRRANLASMLNLFDFGDATSPASKRNQTTIAPQALFMMNSEFITERARNLAKQVAAMPKDTERVNQLYLRVLGRPASASEIDGGLSYVNQFAQKFGAKRTPEDAWFSLSRILISSNEYLYLD